MAAKFTGWTAAYADADAASSAADRSGENPLREVRHAGNALSDQIADELIVAPLRDVVEVLNADCFRDRLRLSQLAGGSCTETDMVSEALLLQLGQGGEAALQTARLPERRIRPAEDSRPGTHRRSGCADCRVRHR